MVKTGVLASAVVLALIVGVLGCGDHGQGDPGDQSGDGDDDGAEADASTGDPSPDAGGDGDSAPPDAGSVWPDDPGPGQFAWARFIPGAGDQVAVALAPDGHILVAADHSGPIEVGSIRLPAPEGDAIVVIALTADAEPLWARSFGGAESVYVQDIAVTSDGRVAVGGMYTGDGFDPGLGRLPEGGWENGFLAMLDGESGATQWVKAFATGASAEMVAAVEAAADGSIYVYGRVNQAVVVDGDAFEEGAFLARFDGDGARRWVQSFDGRPGWQGPMVLDPERGPIVAGRFGGVLELGSDVLTADPADTSQWGSDMYVAAFDPEGIPRFARQIIDEETVALRGLAVNASGDIYLGGHHDGGQLVVDGYTLWNADMSEDPFLLRLSADGRPLWSTTIPSPFDNSTTSMAVGPDGAVYLAAGCNGPVDVAPGFPCATPYGTVVASYGPDDELRWATYAEPAWVEAILPAPDGRLLVAGEAPVGPNVDFGGVSVEGVGLFIAALVPGEIVDPSPPPAPTIVGTALANVPDGQVRQGGTATLLVTGADLAEVTSARLGDIHLRIRERASDQLTLAVAIPHGQDPGPLDLLLRSPGGQAQRSDVVQVTEVIVSPTGTDDGRGTNASPLRLCREDWRTLVKRTDTLRVRSGSYVCPSWIRLPRGVIVQGGGGATTNIRVEDYAGFMVSEGFHGTTELRDLTIEGPSFASVDVSVGDLVMTDIDVVDGGGLHFDSSGTATLTRFRYAGSASGIVVDSGTVIARDVDLDGDRGAILFDGALSIADSTIRAPFECAVQLCDENCDATSPLGRQLTIENSSITGGSCGVSTYGADLTIRDTVITTSDDNSIAVQVSSGTARLTGSTIEAGANGFGVLLQSWFLRDDRAPIATLDDVEIDALIAIRYSTASGSPSLTVRRTRARAVASALSLFGPFGAVDLGRPGDPGQNALDSEESFPITDQRLGAGAPIDARGTLLNGVAHEGDVTGPIEVPGAYSLAGPNVIRF